MFRSYILTSRIYFRGVQDNTKSGRQSETQLRQALYVLFQCTIPRQREKLDFTCLFFQPTPSLCESILVKSITLQSQAGRDTIMFVTICIIRVSYLCREIKTCLISLFFQSTSSLCVSILLESKTGPIQRQTIYWSNIYYLILLSLSIDKERLALLVYFSIVRPRFKSLIEFSLKPDPGRDILTLYMICISPVYCLYRDREIIASLVYILSPHPLYMNVLQSRKNKLDPVIDSLTLNLTSNYIWWNNCDRVSSNCPQAN